MRREKKSLTRRIINTIIVVKVGKAICRPIINRINKETEPEETEE